MSAITLIAEPTEHAEMVYKRCPADWIEGVGKACAWCETSVATES